MDRIPPHNIEAEVCVLGSIILDTSCFYDVCEIIGPDDFYRREHTTIFNALASLSKDNKPIDLVTLKEVLISFGQLAEIGGIEYLSEILVGVPSASNWKYYSEIVRDKSTLRRIIHECDTITQEAYNPSVMASELIEQWQVSAFDKTPSTATLSIKEATEIVITESKQQGYGLSLSIHQLDIAAGGMRGGNVMVLAGETGQGKTTLALNIVRWLCMRNEPTYFITREMGTGELVQRLMANEASVNGMKLRRGTADHAIDQENLALAKITIDKWPLIVDERATTVPHIQAGIRRQTLEHRKPKMVIIDYVQLLSGPGSSYREKYSQISTDLKTLARDTGIPFIVLSQFKRLGETDRRPHKSDLKESGCISCSSSVIFDTSGVQCYRLSRKSSYSLAKGDFVATESKVVPTGKKLVVRIKCHSGRFIDCTPDHKILTDRGWVEAGKLSKDHTIASVRKLQPPADAESIPQAKWMGWMLGNGCMIGYSSPAFICSDTEVAKAFCNTTEALFDRQPRPRPIRYDNVFEYTITYGKVRTPLGNPCKDWCIEHDFWGRKSYDKYIPEWFLAKADDKSIAQLLSGLIETDGCVTGKTLKISTTSLKMAWQVVWCFTRLGIFVFLDKGFSSKKAKHVCYSVGVSNGPDIKLCQELLPLIGAKGRKFCDITPGRGSNHGDRIGTWIQDEITAEVARTGTLWPDLGYRCQGKRISQVRLAQVFDKLPKLKEKYGHLINPSVFWDRFVSRTDRGIEDVFDRTVINNMPNFVANGLVVHNSLENDADFVLLLDSSNDGSGLIDACLDKNRHGPIIPWPEEGGCLRFRWEPMHLRFTPLLIG